MWKKPAPRPVAGDMSWDSVSENVRAVPMEAGMARRPWLTGGALAIAAFAVAYIADVVIQATLGRVPGVRAEFLQPRVDHLARALVMAMMAGLAATAWGLLRRRAAHVQAQGKLGDQERRFRALIRNSYDIVDVVDCDGRIIYESPAAERMLGWTPAERQGRRVFDYVHPDDLPRVLDLHRQSLAGETEGEALVSFRLRHCDGSYRTVEAHVANALDDPAVGGFVVNTRDITRRVQAEEKLRWLSRAVEASPASVVITDVAGQIRYVNPKFTEVTGYTPDEVLGANARVLKSAEMPPEAYRQMWQELVAGRVWNGEFHNRRKDGSLYWEQASISPVWDEQGVLTDFVAVKEDITERKARGAALAESEEKYRMLFSHQFDAVALYDGETGAILDANAAYERIFGYSRGELLQMCSSDLSAEPELSLETRQQALARGWVHVPLLHLRRKDGAEIPVEVSAGGFTWQGRPVVCAILRDISERLRTQQQLEELSVTDALTGLSNWRAFTARLEDDWRRAARIQVPISMIMADVDAFKAYNDSNGHPAGDECLRRVAGALKSAVRRPADMLARYGGEEFAALLFGTDAAGTLGVCEAMQAAVAGLAVPQQASRVSPVVTLSFGVATLLPDDAQEARTLLDAADRALYLAKAAGRNRICAA